MTRYGSYELISELGRGGMGVVYRARHVVLGTPAVVKLLLPEWTQNAEIVQRFVNEARAAANLNHPNIVAVKDCNQAQDGQWFIVLELLDGAPLSKRIHENGGPFDAERTVAVLGQAANALQRAHEADIVHRDVKPDNIFLVHRGDNDLHVVLLDFGIAKLGEARNGAGTRTGVGMGTPNYMAPEQLASAKDVDGRADVYALGVVAFEMLTGGYMPWGGETAAVRIYQRQTTEPAPDPRAIHGAISPALSSVVQRAMACDPVQRWASARDFALALARAVPGTPSTWSGERILQTYAKELTDPAAVPGVSPSSGIPVTTPLGPFSVPAPVGTPWTPPASAAPVTTLGHSAAESAPHTLPPAGRSRRGVFVALAALGTAGAAAAAFVVLSGSQGDSNQRAAGAPPPTAVIDASATTTSVAIMTQPSGAAIFVDDELRGTSPTSVPLSPGATVTVRAELAGHVIGERSHTVGARAETVRLDLVVLADAATPIDAGVDGPPKVARPGGRPKPEPQGPGRPKPPPTSEPPTTGTVNTFDPDNVSGE